MKLTLILWSFGREISKNDGQHNEQYSNLH